jgi:hypothetical protein
MRTQSLLFLVASVATCTSMTLLGACANDGGTLVAELPRAEEAVPGTDAGLDGGDVDRDAEVPCTRDCEYFPDECTPDAFCSNAPFDPSTVGGALNPRTRINIVRGRSPNDVWVAGAVGTLAHFDGRLWTKSPSDTKETLQTIWLRNSEELSFGRLDVLYSRGGALSDAGAASAGGWTPRVIDSFPPEWHYLPVRVAAAWAPSGAEWLWMSTDPAYGYRGLWRLRVTPSGAYELGVGVSTDLCLAFSACNVTSFHGGSASDLWAVGLTGTTVRITDAQSDAPSFKVFNSRTWNALRGVWEASASDAWAVGAAGTVRHYTGDALFWEIVSDVPTPENLNAVWGTSSSDIWVVGDNAVVLHYDGKSWSRVKIAGMGARRPNLTTVWASAPEHVWVGGEGVVLSLGGKP